MPGNGDREQQKIKCVVWDLDNTIWDGTLLEDEKVTLREGIVGIIDELDKRGILQSIASKNEYTAAMEALKRFRIDEYFLYPQINWNSKSSSISTIVQSINIGMDTIAFIDDQPFERDEVCFALPEVLCIDSYDLSGLLNRSEMNPMFITDDSRRRRQMYMSDITRNNLERDFEGAQEEFLASLEMKLSIQPVSDDDLKRAEELTVRTHQLNTTGYTYDYDELNAFRKSDRHILLIAGLDDKYGTYGKIGLVLIECEESIWNIKLLLMSCRVMSRGIGTIIINYIMKLAQSKGVRLRAEFVSNEKNRMMYITYKLTGFKEIGESRGITILENDYSKIQEYPHYVDVRTYY